MRKLYIAKWIYLVAILLVIVGGLNWGMVGAVDYNLVAKFGDLIRLPIVARIIYIVVGLAAIYLAFDRNTYLPFLGETAYPCGSMGDRVPDNATISMDVQVPPNSKVVYWASEHSSEMDVAHNPWEAYTNYANTGVVTADGEGKAILKIREPTKYKTPIGKTLEKHVHYRYCVVPGMLSEVYTVYL